jgi:hypothetical protein
MRIWRTPIIYHASVSSWPQAQVHSARLLCCAEILSFSRILFICYFIVTELLFETHRRDGLLNLKAQFKDVLCPPVRQSSCWCANLWCQPPWTYELILKENSKLDKSLYKKHFFLRSLCRCTYNKETNKSGSNSFAGTYDAKRFDRIFDDASHRPFYNFITNYYIEILQNLKHIYRRHIDQRERLNEISFFVYHTLDLSMNDLI